MNKKKFNSRNFRYGTLATALSVGFLVLVILLNVIASVITSKYPISIDLTTAQIYDITDESKDYIKTLEKDVEIIVLNSEEAFTGANTYYSQANEIIKSYTQNSDKISLEYIDIVKNPTFASQYPDYEFNLSDVLVKCGDNIQQISRDDLFNIQQASTQGSYQVSSTAEQAITSAIVKATSDNRPKVVFLAGYGEVDSSALQSLLSRNNYDVVVRNPATDGIDEDAEVVVSVAPMRDYEREVVTKIEDFLSNGENLGKNFFYFASPDQSETPNISAFLEENGIAIGTGSVYETSNSRIFSNNPFYAVVDYVSNEFYDNMKNKNIFATIPRSRPISILWEGQGYISTSAMLNFSNSCVIRPADAPDDWQPSQSDLNSASVIPAMVHSTRVRYDEAKPTDSTIVVTGSISCIESSILNRTNLANAEYIVSVFNTLTEQKSDISIVPKSLDQKTLGITTNQVITIAVVFAIVLPLVVMALGIAVWLIRRHR